MVLMNPIVPHFSQYCWTKYIYPVLKNSKNYCAEVSENLSSQQWPKSTAPYDKVAGSRLHYLKEAKSTIRQGIIKAQSGGKKKKKGNAPEEAKVLENCVVFVAKEYPEFQKKCL